MNVARWQTLRTMGRGLALMVAVLLTPPAMGQDDIKNPPWHLVDLWWDLGAEAEFSSLAIDVTLRDDVDADAKLYVAPVGLAKLNGAGFYGGIQTNVLGWVSKTERRIVNHGRGGIFSRWGERSLEAVRLASGGFCESAGYEGDFVSVRRPYAWKAGRYTFRWVRLDTEFAGDAAYTWVGMFIRSHEDDEEHFIGALRFEGEKLTLGRQTASFVEIYGPRIPPEEIPKLTVTFSDVRVGGRPVEGLHARAAYPQGVPDYARAEAADGGVRVTVGQPIERDRRSEGLF